MLHHLGCTKVNAPWASSGRLSAACSVTSSLPVCIKCEGRLCPNVIRMPSALKRHLPLLVLWGPFSHGNPACLLPHPVQITRKESSLYETRKRSPQTWLLSFWAACWLDKNVLGLLKMVVLCPWSPFHLYAPLFSVLEFLTVNTCGCSSSIHPWAPGALSIQLHGEVERLGTSILPVGP